MFAMKYPIEITAILTELEREYKTPTKHNLLTIRWDMTEHDEAELRLQKASIFGT